MSVKGGLAQDSIATSERNLGAFVGPSIKDSLNINMFVYVNLKIKHQTRACHE